MLSTLRHGVTKWVGLKYYENKIHYTILYSDWFYILQGLFKTVWIFLNITVYSRWSAPNILVSGHGNGGPTVE